MPEHYQTRIDKKDKELELFEEFGWDKDDLDYFYATAKYIEAKSPPGGNRLCLMPEDFISFKSTLEKKRYYYKSLSEWLQKFIYLYFDVLPSNVLYRKEHIAMYDWYDKYSRTKRSGANVASNGAGERITPYAHVPIAPERKYVLLLAIEISRLQPELLEKVQSGAVIIDSSALQNFYRLPWIWHYGPGELEEMKATLANELAIPKQEADSLMIGTAFKSALDVKITPEIKGSEMRAVFEKLNGKTFKLLCDFRMVDLGKSSVKFYRMP